MDFFSNLAFGFGVALAPGNLLCALVGGLLGTLLGVLPGMGPVTALALLLPATYALAPVPALILLAALYCGTERGRAIAAMLVRSPGDAVPGMRNGKPVTRQGQAGAALAAGGLASFFAACVLLLALAATAPLLATLALPFGPADVCALMVLGLVSAAMLAAGSRLKALAMVVLGLLLSLVGGGGTGGVLRFAFGVPELADGIGLVAVALGVFGYGEILVNLAQAAPARQLVAVRLRGLWPGWRALGAMPVAALRGTVLGALLGVVPGGGARLSSFAALALEEKMAPGQTAAETDPVRAAAASGAASQAGAQSALLPLLSLGLPTNAVMVLLLGALNVHKLQSGPQLMGTQPELFWGLMASLLLANGMLLALNLPLVALWSRLMRLPYRWLFPAIVLCCSLGVYTLHHSLVDICLLAGFGLLGYVFHKLGMVPAPLLLGYVLGPVLEENLRQALQRAQGDWSVFVVHPLSAGLLLATLLVLVLLPGIRARHRDRFIEA